MIDINVLFRALEKNEFNLLLKGAEPYKLELSQYVPSDAPTDVGKMLSNVIYKAYKLQPSIKEEFERTLMIMLGQTTFDVYVVILYIVSELFKEKNGLAPFNLNLTEILPRVKYEIQSREKDFQEKLKYPNGYIKTDVWDEIKRFNSICKKEYHIELF